MKIIYTHTDEAPALATRSLLPIVEAFASSADVDVEIRDLRVLEERLHLVLDPLEDAVVAAKESLAKNLIPFPHQSDVAI